MDDVERLMRKNLPFSSNEWKALASTYDLDPIEDGWRVGVLALVNPSLLDGSLLRSRGIRVNTRAGNILSMRLPVSHLAELAQMPGILHMEAGPVLSPDLQNTRTDTRTDSVAAGLGGLSRSFTGAEVVIGIIDWGFDYTHPVFYDSTLTEMRLTRAWDQNKLSGPAPDGYGFGTEYVGMAELLAAEQDTLYVFGPGSHGTHVGGIAGGNGAGTAHVGIATDAELVFVSLRRDAPSLADAIAYITGHAESVGKPCVINMSFGSHLGPHDGTDLKNQAIDALAGQGKVFVGSAGNNGNSPFHLLHTFDDEADTLLTEVRFANGIPDMFGQTLSMWGSAQSSFGVQLRMVNNLNETVYETPYYHSSDEPSLNDTVVISAFDTLVIRMQSVASSVMNGKPNIRCEVRRTGNLRLVLAMVSQNSEVHIWNNVRMNNRYTNWGEPLVSNYPGAVAGDTEFGLGEPAGVGNSVVTVAAHRAEVFTGSGVMLYGNLANFSSRGPTVDGRVKPDISAPGLGVRSSVNSFDPANDGNTGSVSFNGREYPFANYSGTSMSGPAVTGIVALMLEANPQLTASEVKDILHTTARLDQRTGEIGPEGTTDWGWGKADALAAVRASDIFASVDGPVRLEAVALHPNPTESLVTITGMMPDRARVFDINGRLIAEHAFPAGGGEHPVTVNLGGMTPGIYLLELYDGDRVGFGKVVVR